MKSKLLLFLLCYSCFSLAQTQESLKPEALKFYEGHYYMDFKTIADMIYPKVLESTTKDAFIEKLDTDYQNNEFRKRLQLVHPVFQYSSVKTIDGKSFCVITYKNPTRYFFEQKLDAAAAEKKVAELKRNTKTQEVIFEPVRNSINVKRVSKLIAVADETTQNQWNFIDFDDIDQEAIFNKIFNENIKKALGL